MDNNSNTWHKGEMIFLPMIFIFILVQGLLNNDSPIAMISAVCGIAYTFIAGKGYPVCYLFGLTGSVFYCYLSYQNMLWGNLLLYLAYYIPMQVCGYFQWNKNLKTGKKDIVKIRLPRKEFTILLLVLFVLTVIAYFVLVYFNDARPLLDSITAVLSIGGMYLTVRRAIEQWQIWMIVNALSLIMWLSVALLGVKVYSTIIMWAVYLVLAFYFYYKWKKEL